MNPLRPFLLVMALGLAPMPSGSATSDDVRAADAAFAARAAAAGHHAAFVEYLADDAVLFRPEAVRGQEWLATNEPAGGRLDWTPSAAALDCSGRLAITTGPWRYSNDGGGDPVAGHYLSVWRLGPQSQWQVILDHGIDHAPDATPAVPLQAALSRLWPVSDSSHCKGRGEAGDLARAEAGLNAEVGRQGLSRALLAAAVEGALAYRDDVAPGLLVVLSALADAGFGPGTTAEPGGTIFEAGTNLAVTHGVLLSADGGSRSLYVRVWSRERRRWQLAVDMRTPLPVP